MSEIILELQDIDAGYERNIVLEHVHLVIRSDDFIGIIGPNGGGKTTLLKVMLGLLKPVRGHVVYHRPKQNLFGYLPQNNVIDKQFPLNVTEVVLSGLLSEKGLFGSYRRTDRTKAVELLEKYGMGSFVKTPIGELSGGQLQRVLLCRAIISSPLILILDEPTTFVDNQFEQEFYTLLRELNAKMGIVMVSHDIGTICSHVKTIACVNHGLHYHHSNIISEKQLKAYNCPIELIAHGNVPHRVLTDHQL